VYVALNEGLKLLVYVALNEADTQAALQRRASVSAQGGGGGGRGESGRSGLLEIEEGYAKVRP
jgi:hypothetical protein